MKKTGTVYLVGAGPGDPGLLTLRGKELLTRAEVVVYDSLANPRLLDWAGQAEKLYVGKRAGQHSLKQEQINALLISLAKKGRQVVRLKGGDPFVFGRGGEEALALVEAGLKFEVVPGISSGSAALAYAGIPLTHRGLAASALFATGREREGKDQSSLDYKAMAGLDGTLVFFMGVENAPLLCDRLLKAGLDAATPAAAIQWGTHPGQRTLVSRLDRFAADLADSTLGSPALLVIGKVVSLRKRLNWFEGRPLFGCRVVVTRAREQASGLAQRLEELGAEVWQVPAIEIRPLKANQALIRSFDKLAETDWLIFTSTNGVEIYFDALSAAGKDARALGGVKVAAIGPATAESLAARGVKADLQPPVSTAEGLARALAGKGKNLKGQRLVLARAKEGRSALPDGLKRSGALVTDLPLYETLPSGKASRKILLDALKDGGIDAVTFSSGSTVEHFKGMFSRPEWAAIRGSVKACSIGPVTSGALKAAGLKVAAEAEEPGVEALSRAVLTLLGGRASV